jgi:hypothetical protein
MEPNIEPPEALEQKLRAAVSAGWKVVVIEAVFITVAWLAYLATITGRAGWLLALWGPEVSWPTVATVSVLAIAAFKVMLWLQAALVLWAWMWARALRRSRVTAESGAPATPIEAPPEPTPSRPTEPATTG